MCSECSSDQISYASFLSENEKNDWSLFKFRSYVISLVPRDRVSHQARLIPSPPSLSNHTTSNKLTMTEPRNSTMDSTLQTPPCNVQLYDAYLSVMLLAWMSLFPSSLSPLPSFYVCLDCTILMLLMHLSCYLKPGHPISLPHRMIMAPT
jgi:hypothetical protein